MRILDIRTSSLPSMSTKESNTVDTSHAATPPESAGDAGDAGESESEQDDRDYDGSQPQTERDPQLSTDTTKQSFSGGSYISLEDESCGEKKRIHLSTSQIIMEHEFPGGRRQGIRLGWDWKHIAIFFLVLMLGLYLIWTSIWNQSSDDRTYILLENESPGWGRQAIRIHWDWAYFLIFLLALMLGLCLK